MKYTPFLSASMFLLLLTGARRVDMDPYLLPGCATVLPQNEYDLPLQSSVTSGRVIGIFTFQL